MGTPGEGSTALSDVTNIHTLGTSYAILPQDIYTTPCINTTMSTTYSEEDRKREERNRKQHEYRARIRKGRRGIRGSMSTVLSERPNQVHFQ